VHEPRAGITQAVARVARTPNPRIVARSSFVWSVVAAAGAATLASAGVTMLFAVVLRGFGAYPSSFADGLAVAVGLATGLGAAFVGGGADALAAYAGIVALVRIIATGATLRFCAPIVSPAPDTCSFFGYAFGLWPYVLGAVLGYICVRWFRPREGDANPLLEVLGALALVETVFISIDSFLFPSATSLESGLLGLVILVTAGIACGLTVLRRVPERRQWIILGIVALVVTGPWLLTELPAFLAQIGFYGHLAVGSLPLMLFLRPFVEIFAAVVVLYVAVARKVTAPAATG
jgi:hypothetical protein